MDNNVLKGAVEPMNNEQKLGQVIMDAFDKNPDHVSQIDAETGSRSTFREMKDRGIRCALWMTKLGVGPNDIVVACTHNHLDSYIPVVATLFVDAIFTAWNDCITVYTARSYMKEYTPKVIFACEKAAGILLEASQLEQMNIEIVVFGTHSNLPTITGIMNDQTNEEISRFTVVNVKSSKEVAIISLSSGSTGFPKGVMLSHKSLLPLSKPLNNCSKYLWYSKLDWISCISCLLLTIIAEQSRVVHNYYEAEDILQIIDKYQVNRILFPSILIAYMAKSDCAQKYDLKSLETVIITGSKYNKGFLAAIQRIIPNAFISNTYATTEVGVVATSTLASKHLESVGFVNANVQLKVVDVITGKSLGPNENGEIFVKTPSVMNGYYNNPEATKEVYDDDGWYHTGDIGYYDETGEIFLVERIKEIMKYRNHQISPAEIEELLLSHPEIQEAVVVALPHELDGDWPLAFCKKTPEGKVTEDDLMKLTSVLEDFKKLRGGIRFVDQLLYTPSGKIARNEMKRLAKNSIQFENES